MLYKMINSAKVKSLLRIELVCMGLIVLVLQSGFSGPVASAASNLSSVSSDISDSQKIVPGQVILKIKPGVLLPQSGDLANVPSSFSSTFSQLGVTKWKKLGDNFNVYLLLLSGGVEDAISALDTIPEVEKAEPNYTLQISDTPITANDPLYPGKQWYLDKIQAPQAWTITTGSKNVIVAVIDSGINEDHPDLAGKVIKRYDFLNDQPTVVDEVGHGTAVASCITANTNNGIGLAGLNWNVSLLNLKAGGEQLYSFDVARAIIYAVDNGAQVINGSFSGTVSTMVQDLAIGYAEEHNVTLVFAAGNSGSSAAQYPADTDGVIAVGATNNFDQVTGFSNFGPRLSVTAPGAGIWAAAPGGGYVAINGTSFSSPIVAGVAALMLSVNPKLTPRDIKNILEGTAEDISGHGFTPQTGWGRVNAYRAVLAAKNGDLRPNKNSLIKGKVSGIDPANVRISLDPSTTNGIFSTTPIQPDAQGNFQISGLGHATYHLRAALKGSGTAQGVVEISLNGHADNRQEVNFAFQNLKLMTSGADQFVDQARFFDTVPSTNSQAGSFYFKETGHTLGGTFQNFWQHNGGVAVFGFPISEPFQELSATDGQIHTVQYFERNRFELHPEFAGTDSEVLLGLLGSEETANLRSNPAFVPVLSSNTASDTTYFEATSHSISGKFKEYWQQNGGVAIFGYPISQPFLENGHLVQYFERNRFELHEENSGTDYEVLLGLLGNNLAAQLNYITQ